VRVMGVCFTLCSDISGVFMRGGGEVVCLGRADRGARKIYKNTVGRGLFDVLHLHISNRKVGNQKCSLGVVHEDATKEFKSFISRAGSVEHSSFLVRT
jgi:hypothetical protein